MHRGVLSWRHAALTIDEAFLFDAQSLVGRLRERGVKIGVATSVRAEEWDRARIWPSPAADVPLRITADQEELLCRFRAAMPEQRLLLRPGLAG